MPGLSTMKSLPCFMARMPSGARSSGMEALTTSWMLLSSSTSLSLRATFACGNRLTKAAVRSGSFANIETSSPPPRITASTWLLMWPWLMPTTPNLILGAVCRGTGVPNPGAGRAASAAAEPGDAADELTPTDARFLHVAAPQVGMTPPCRSRKFTTFRAGQREPVRAARQPRRHSHASNRRSGVQEIKGRLEPKVPSDLLISCDSSQ